MQFYLDQFETWCCHWHFLLNPDKYQLFSNCRILPQISLCMCTQPVAFTQNQQVLGVTFDSPHLNFAAHIQSVQTECLMRLNVLKALSALMWGASIHLLRQVYFVFICSKLEYGCSVLGELPSTCMKFLNGIHNSALRLILSARHTSPILSLETECFLPPLCLHFCFLIMEWTLQYLYLPEQSSLTCLLGLSQGGAPINLQPFAVQAQSLFNDHGLSLPQRVGTLPSLPSHQTPLCVGTFVWTQEQGSLCLFILALPLLY
jgi:hypothetical protein